MLRCKVVNGRSYSDVNGEFRWELIKSYREK